MIRMQPFYVMGLVAYPDSMLVSIHDHAGSWAISFWSRSYQTTAYCCEQEKTNRRKSPGVRFCDRCRRESDFTDQLYRGVVSQSVSRRDQFWGHVDLSAPQGRCFGICQPSWRVFEWQLRNVMCASFAADAIKRYAFLANSSWRARKQ
jgi:hypothetical protein